MSIRIRIDGVYDIRTLKSLIENQVYDISFDFRPKSFNFLQQYKFEEIYQQYKNHSLNFYLKFSEEQTFVVENIIKDKSSQNVFLEFDDNNSLEYYEQFKMKFFYHYNFSRPISEIIASPLLEGLIIPFGLLEQRQEKGNLLQMTSNFLTQIGNKKIKLILEGDWDSNLFPSLFELFDFDLYSLPVNHKIEVCYRNVDLNAMTKSLSICNSMINS